MKLLKRRRKILVPNSESGRQVDLAGFMLCFISVILLSSGLILMGISIWTVRRKEPYYILLNVKVDVPYFTIPAGVVSCSSFWIAASLHNNRENYRFIYLLISLLTISLVLIIAGVSMGMMKESVKDSLGFELTPVNWRNLNHTLENTLKKYHYHTSYRSAWDRIQSQLKCCGLNTPDNWKKYGKLPNSCCDNQKMCSFEKSFSKGCLNLIQRDLLNQKHFLAVYCYFVATLEGIIVIATANIYYWNKSRN